MACRDRPGVRRRRRPHDLREHLGAVLVAGPARGTLTLNPNGSFTYTPDAGYTGPDAFTYVVADARGKADTATVTLTVQAALGTASPERNLPLS